MTATKTRWVARIYPRSPAKGYLARTYLLTNSGYGKFEVHRGWYEIDEEVIPRLRRARNRHGDPDSKPVFQICTAEEAAAIDRAEEEEVAKASRPIPIPRARRAILDKAKSGAVKPAKRPVKKEEAPAYFETADPEDPEDQEFMEDDEWPEDLSSLAEDEDSEDEDEGSEDEPPQAKKKVAKKAAKKTSSKKKVAKKAAKKTSSPKAAKKTAKKRR